QGGPPILWGPSAFLLLRLRQGVARPWLSYPSETSHPLPHCRWPSSAAQLERGGDHRARDHVRHLQQGPASTETPVEGCQTPRQEACATQWKHPTVEQQNRGLIGKMAPLSTEPNRARRLLRLLR